MEKVNKATIIAIILLEVRFFYQILLPGGLNLYNYYNNKILICAVMVCGLICMVLKVIKLGYFHKRIFSLSVASLMVIYILQVFFSSITYDRGIGEILKESYYFLLVLLYFELTYCCRNKKGYKFFFNFTISCCAITSFLFFVQGVVYNATGNLFLKIFEVVWQDEISMRGGKIRLIQPSTLCCFTIVLSAAEIVKSIDNKELRKDKFHMFINLTNMVIGMCYAAVVAQTRMLTISLVLSIFVMFMILKFKNQFKKILFIMMLFIGAFAFLNSSVASDFFASFTAKEENGSVYARQEAYAYYMGKITSNPIVPIGIINQASFPRGYAILHGPQGYLYPSDVGLLGLAVVMGVQSIIWFFLFVLKLFRLIREIRKVNKSNDYIELIGVLLYLLCTTGSLVCLDCERILMIPFIMTVFEYKYKEIFNKLEEDDEIKNVKNKFK